MAGMAFHSEANERLCFAYGNIIMKNAHLIEPSLFQNIRSFFLQHHNGRKFLQETCAIVAGGQRNIS